MCLILALLLLLLLLPIYSAVALGSCDLDMSEQLIAVAKQLLLDGKGILAADESTGTVGKRLASINTENSEANRAALREMLFTTPGIGQHISGELGGATTTHPCRFLHYPVAHWHNHNHGIVPEATAGPPWHSLQCGDSLAAAPDHCPNIAAPACPRPAGVILYEETLFQKGSNGQRLVDHLTSQGELQR